MNTRLTFLTGPVRSGKSRRAVELAQAYGDTVVFVATWHPTANDAEMEARVRRHRAERPANWRTLEAPRQIAAEIEKMTPLPQCVILDCLTLWLSDRLDSPDDAIIEQWRGELASFRRAPRHTIVVGNEVGWSPVPEHPLTRRFRDLAGTLSQLTAGAAHDAWLMVAGCSIRLR